MGNALLKKKKAVPFSFPSQWPLVLFGFICFQPGDKKTKAHNKAAAEKSLEGSQFFSSNNISVSAPGGNNYHSTSTSITDGAY